MYGKQGDVTMSKPKKSGPALFMHAVIAVALVTTAACFLLYYGGFVKSGVVLWTGIVTFTIMYHFWVRILMGNVTKRFAINYRQWWFKERAFEKRLYKLLQVKRWKDKALTYDPQSFSLKDHSLEEIANTMSKSEVDHWINQLIALSTVLFSLWWGQFWIFFATALAACLFDAQFIAIQRYNRPRLVKLIQRQNRSM